VHSLYCCPTFRIRWPIYFSFPFFLLLLAGAWNWFSLNILPYIVDWVFVLLLGIFMALVSFIIDYFIEQIRKGV